MQISEHDLQVSYFDWLRLKANQDSRYGMIFAIPNGGYRPIATARKMKMEGVRAGVWDILCPVPSCDGTSSMMFAEFKILGNGLTQAQRQFQIDLNLISNTVRWHVWLNLDIAMQDTEKYIGDVLL